MAICSALAHMLKFANGLVRVAWSLYLQGSNVPFLENFGCSNLDRLGGCTYILNRIGQDELNLRHNGSLLPWTHLLMMDAKVPEWIGGGSMTNAFTKFKRPISLEFWLLYFWSYRWEYLQWIQVCKPWQVGPPNWGSSIHKPCVTSQLQWLTPFFMIFYTGKEGGLTCMLLHDLLVGHVAFFASSTTGGGGARL